MKTFTAQALLTFLAIVAAGCGGEKGRCDREGYVCLKIDPRSSQVVAAALWPQLEAMNRQRMEMMAQHKWLRESLDKSIRILEQEKGLEPLQLASNRPLAPAEPNCEHEYPQNEPLCVPYEAPDVSHVDGQPSLYIMQALLNLEILALNSYMAGAKDCIENFEHRLQRLECVR